MVNPFEQTPAEKEECVLDMLERGYGYPQIMKECHVSPNTISSVKKKFSGDDASKSASQISKETQALKLFKEGWKPVDIAIELDLESDSVFQLQKKFYQLIGLDEFNQAYKQINGNLDPFLQLINSMNRLGMTAEQVAEQVKYGVNLSYLQSIHTKMNNQIQDMASKLYYLDSQLQSTEQQVQQCKNLLQKYDNECIQKRNEIKRLSNEMERKKMGIRILNFKVQNIRAKKAAMANRISDAE